MLKWNASIKREDSVAISACINFSKPNPTSSNSTPFMTLNSAIRTRPVR